MNKKTAVIFPLLILSFLIILTGCGSNVADKKDQDNGQKNAYNSTAPADSNNSVKDDGESEKKAEPEDSKKYLDLSKMSGTAVYSEVYNIMIEPDKYNGWTIKIRGTCSVYKDEASGKTYYACIIKDAAACCSQGFEFELQKGVEPPENDDTITVKGKFKTYKEKDVSYSKLENAVLE